jgi:arylsulfatase A-like enzyme
VPARACLITGKSASTTGFLSNNFVEKWNYKNTLMEVLRDNGYQTINVGKNHFRPVRKGLGFEINRIYETHNDENGLTSDYHLWLEHETNGRVHDTAKDHECNGRVLLPWAYEPYLHPTEWTLNESISQLERRDPSRPFYLQMSFHRPHPPIDPPLHYYEMYRNAKLPEIPVGDWVDDVFKSDDDTLLTNPFEGKFKKEDLDIARRGYYASISHIDAQIGKLMIWLKRKKILNNTMIIFTSDHGEMLGDHNMFRKGPAFEGAAKIPFIIKLPKASVKNSKISTPVSLIDIMPTILDAADIKCPSDVEGTSVVPLLNGEKLENREYVFGENYRQQPARGWNFIAGERYKFVWESNSGLELFFDLDNDPQELHNLIADKTYEGMIKEYRQYLIYELSKRPSDGLTDENGLLPGKVLPSYRELTQFNF